MLMVSYTRWFFKRHISLGHSLGEPEGIKWLKMVQLAVQEHIAGIRRIAFLVYGLQAEKSSYEAADEFQYYRD